MIQIILVESHPIVRNGVKLLIDGKDNLSVIGEADSGKEALSLLENKIRPDIILTALTLEPEMDGFELMLKLKDSYPTIHVIVLSLLKNRSQVTRAFTYGAKGYLVKNVGYNELLHALNYVQSGGHYLCEELTSYLLNESCYPTSVYHNTNAIIEFGISQRELEILELIGEGFKNKEIAERLFISKRTVEVHRQNLIGKMGVKNSAELIKLASKQGLI
ncbi:MAG: response regulator transcription factor [Sphingobacterium sp.]|jgi:DNA-binding NarL/FixJ family response regulator|nr:response regulator transcription factor [Sphingobacterium sp.]